MGLTPRPTPEERHTRTHIPQGNSSTPVNPEKSWRSLELIRWTTDFFAQKGIDSPRLDAELLLAQATGWSRIDLYARFEEVISKEKLAGFRELVRRRGKREPLKYLVGEAGFHSLAFVVDPRVMIPRPETEVLVEKAREKAVGPEAPVIADVGTGCGNLAVVLAREIPSARVFASDISAAALEVARLNARKLGVAERISFLEGDLYQPFLEQGLGGKVSLIVSNPPYVSESEYGQLQPEITEFEPRVALVAGEDGLAVIRALIREAPSLLVSGGWLLLEMGEGQAQKVLEFFGLTADFILRDMVPDYQGIPRVVRARKK